MRKLPYRNRRNHFFGGSIDDRHAVVAAIGDVDCTTIRGCDNMGRMLSRRCRPKNCIGAGINLDCQIVMPADCPNGCTIGGYLKVMRTFNPHERRYDFIHAGVDDGDAVTILVCNPDCSLN